MNISRPLTQEELTEGREKARQKHSEMLSQKEKGETSVTTTQLEPADDEANQMLSLQSSSKFRNKLLDSKRQNKYANFAIKLEVLHQSVL